MSGRRCDAMPSGFQLAREVTDQKKYCRGRHVARVCPKRVDWHACRTGHLEPKDRLNFTEGSALSLAGRAVTVGATCLLWGQVGGCRGWWGLIDGLSRHHALLSKCMCTFKMHVHARCAWHALRYCMCAPYKHGYAHLLDAGTVCSAGPQQLFALAPAQQAWLGMLTNLPTGWTEALKVRPAGRMEKSCMGTSCGAHDMLHKTD